LREGGRQGGKKDGGREKQTDHHQATVRNGKIARVGSGQSTDRPFRPAIPRQGDGNKALAACPTYQS
jgi:hypothetical protein